jgi:general secretion pathway protein M
MKQWFAGLNNRERRIVSGGAIVLLIILVYLLIWEPLSSRHAELQKSVQAQRNTYAWMQQAAHEIRQLSGKAASIKKQSGSMLGTINNTAKPVLRGAILKRVEEDRQQGVRVWIEQVAFDDLIRWLGQIQQQYGIRVSSLVSERHAKPGRVNVRLILQRS